jgi:hypothetical protein
LASTLIVFESSDPVILVEAASSINESTSEVTLTLVDAELGTRAVCVPEKLTSLILDRPGELLEPDCFRLCGL